MPCGRRPASLRSSRSAEQLVGDVQGGEGQRPAGSGSPPDASPRISRARSPRRRRARGRTRAPPRSGSCTSAPGSRFDALLLRHFGSPLVSLGSIPDRSARLGFTSPCHGCTSYWMSSLSSSLRMPSTWASTSLRSCRRLASSARSPPVLDRPPGPRPWPAGCRAPCAAGRSPPRRGVPTSRAAPVAP